MIKPSSPHAFAIQCEKHKPYIQIYLQSFPDTTEVHEVYTYGKKFLEKGLKASSMITIQWSSIYFPPHDWLP